MWNKVPECDLQEAGIPCNEPLLGYSPEWVDPDFNPDGIRECFIGGEGTWISAKWLDEQDTYINDEQSSPTHWLPMPSNPAAKTEESRLPTGERTEGGCSTSNSVRLPCPKYQPDKVCPLGLYSFCDSKYPCFMARQP